jgi:hypothetical protein
MVLTDLILIRSCTSKEINGLCGISDKIGHQIVGVRYWTLNSNKIWVEI